MNCLKSCSSNEQLKSEKFHEISFDKDMAPAEDGLIILDDDHHFFNLRKELKSYPPDMIERMKEKLVEIYEDQDFKFKTVILELILAHENSFIKKYEEALKIFDKIQLEIETLEKIDCNDSLFVKVSKALLNVIRTCKAYILILQDDDKKARKIVSDIIPSTDLDKANRAAIFGIRAMLFVEYGLYGHKIALENAEKAKEIDRKNPYWHFLYGKALGRIRRVETPYNIPSDKERQALKTAIRMEGKNYLFMLFTAENYVETSSKTYQFHTRNKSLYPSLKLALDDLNEEASCLFNKCINLQPKCSHVLFRAAKGFLNLPYPQKDPERAKELLIEGLKNNPRNPFANHLLARYYERHASNIPKAMECLKICREQRVFGAEMDLLRLEYSKNQDGKYVLDRLEEILDVYCETPRKLQILTQMASYYIFIDSNIIKASELLKEAMKMNCEDNIVNHRSLFIRAYEPFSILEVLVDEMKIDMEKKCDEAKKKIYESFIFDLNDSNYPISKGRAKNFKDEILKEDENLRSNLNFRKKYVGIRGRGSFLRPNRRPSFSRCGPTSTNGRKVEKAQSVQQVDDFFDSWSSDNSKKEPKRRINSGKNSLNNSYSDFSVASDSRYSSTTGRHNNNSCSKPDNDEEFEFDQISAERSKYSSPGKENGNRKLEEEFDKLSISSRNPDSRFSAPCGGRGRSAYSSSRDSFHDRDDFEETNLGRGRRRGYANSAKYGAEINRPNTPERAIERRRDTFSPCQQRPSEARRDFSSSQIKDQSSKTPPWRRKAPLDKEESDSEDDLMSYFKKK